MIFDVQRFSTHDGEGIRTVVFLKGCSLVCPWCHNPESRSLTADLLYDERLCIKGCTECCKASAGSIERQGDHLEIHREMLTEQNIEQLRNVCPAKALTVCGEERSISSLLAEIEKDRPYYEQSGGGVTISGGEPFMQPTFVAELSQAVKEAGISTAVETCLHVPWQYIEPSLPYLDCFLADLKHTNEAKFAQWANGSVKMILRNFRHLDEAHQPMIARVPVVPRFNDTEHELSDIIDFAASLANLTEIHFLPYHTLGIGKYKLLDMAYTCSTTPLNNPELLAFAERYASDQGLSVKLRG